MNRCGEPPIGVVLSGSTTSRARVQLTEFGERIAVEGMLVVVDTKDGSDSILARIDRIVPVNDAYREGDLWTEIRRKEPDNAILRQIGRSYMLAELFLIKPLRGSDIRYPPLPGDPVYRLRKEDIDAVIPRDRSGVILFGSILGYEDLPLPLDVENLTMHIGIFGETGSGKSYTVGYLIELLSRIRASLNGREIEVALPTIVIDANGDYLDFYREFVDNQRAIGAYRAVYRYVFRNSFVLQAPFLRHISIDLNVFSPREVAEIIVAYRSGGLELNELQVNAIEKAIVSLQRDYGVSLTEMFSRKSFVDDLIARLEELGTAKKSIHIQTARAAARAIEKFYEDVVEKYGVIGSEEPSLSPQLIDDITARPSLVILDFSSDGAPGVPVVVKQLVVAYLLRLLYTKFVEYKSRGDERYLLLVIEEAQNYAPNTKSYPIPWSVARDYLALIATQGRKFGICLAIVSQRPIFVDPVVLSMINTWIIHRVAPDDVMYIERICGAIPRSLAARLTRLSRGVALVVGQMNMLGVPILVRVGRRRVPHTMGRTRLVESLARTILRDDERRPA